MESWSVRVKRFMPRRSKDGENFARIAVTFAAELSQQRSGAGPGEVRVDMHIALHDFHSKSTRLLTDESRANVLKIQILN